ncbi:MAG: LysM peptidoglycan-binding domain-containing protein [Mariprofundaceae bacterium]
MPVTTSILAMVATKITNPLLKGLSPRDLARVQADAKRMYAKYWKNISQRSRYVRARILPLLEHMHAPQQLQVVPIAESGYNPYAFSSAGATGLWQVMPATARGLGMKAPSGYDSRRHVETSTRGGVQYLLDMYAMFGNWPTAFAAYHRGPGSMKKRLRRHPWQPQDGLDHMPVPRVTRTYVRGIIGLSMLLQRGVWQFPQAWETHAVTLNGPLDVNLLAKVAGIDHNEIYRFNPGLNHSQYLKNKVTLHVPESMIEPLLSSVGQAAPAYVLTHVRSGDSLWRLARRHHTSVHDLKRINPGIGKLLHPGQRINVPASYLSSAHPPLNPMLAQGRRIHYRVRSGDSLWRIAKRFGTTPSAIARANSIRTRKTLHPGDRLWVLARARPS